MTSKSNIQNQNLMKRTVIIPDPGSHIEVKVSWIEFNVLNRRESIAFANVKALYLHKDIQIDMPNVIYLSEFFPVYFIDDNKTIIGKIVRKI